MSARVDGRAGGGDGVVVAGRGSVMGGGGGASGSVAKLRRQLKQQLRALGEERAREARWQVR